MVDDEPALLVLEYGGNGKGMVLLNEDDFSPKIKANTSNSTGESNIWYLHNGANNHMYGQRSKFRNLDEGVTSKKLPKEYHDIGIDADILEYVCEPTMVVEKAIKPASQTQPHVIVRPRTSFFEGVDFQLKRNFVTVQEVKQQKLDKKKLAKDAYEQEKKTIENVPDQQINKKRNRRSDNEKKIASELTEKKNATEKENNNATDNEPQQKKNPSEKEMPVPSGKEKATSKRKRRVEKGKDITVKQTMRSLVNNAQKATNGVRSPPTSLKPVGRHPTPPLPVDLTKLERVPNNQGIGKSSTKNQRRRGPAKMNHVFTRKLEDRPIICLNSEFQPYSKKDKVVNELSRILGMIARDRIKNKPANIQLEQFMVILKYWSDKAVQDKVEKNVANRKKVTDTHNVGRTTP
ncbi:hypothetical protein AgCh_035906 [Apium graveolens]